MPKPLASSDRFLAGQPFRKKVMATRSWGTLLGGVTGDSVRKLHVTVETTFAARRGSLSCMP